MANDFIGIFPTFAEAGQDKTYWEQSMDFMTHSFSVFVHQKR
jgi:hypothetical protein